MAPYSTPAFDAEGWLDDSSEGLDIPAPPSAAYAEGATAQAAGTAVSAPTVIRRPVHLELDNLGINTVLAGLRSSAETGPKAFEPYQPMTDASGLRDVPAIARSLAQYVRQHGIQTVCFVDQAARPAQAAMREHWRAAYPDLPMPTVRFLNPLGFIAQEDVRDGTVDVAALTRKAQ